MLVLLACYGLVAGGVAELGRTVAGAAWWLLQNPKGRDRVAVMAGPVRRNPEALTQSRRRWRIAA